MLHMVHEGDRIVHLVHVVAREDHRIFAVEITDDLAVLVDGIGRALVPVVAAEALVGRQHLHEFVDFTAQETPGELDVADQAVARVLGQHRDAPYARVDGIRQREVDDAEFTAEMDCRLGAV